MASHSERQGSAARRRAGRRARRRGASWRPVRSTHSYPNRTCCASRSCSASVPASTAVHHVHQLMGVLVVAGLLLVLLLVHFLDVHDQKRAVFGVRPPPHLPQSYLLREQKLQRIRGLRRLDAIAKSSPSAAGETRWKLGQLALGIFPSPRPPGAGKKRIGVRFSYFPGPKNSRSNWPQATGDRSVGQG